MDAHRVLPGYELKDELARYCLPQAYRNSDRKLAWVNSICILFLLIGILGRPGSVSVKRAPAIEEAAPVLLQPLPPPPAKQQAQESQSEPDEQKPEVAQVVVVVPDAPNITFAVPTIGNLVAPNALAQAPPLRPMQSPAALRNVPSSLITTGAGGERPQPTYPKIALDQGEQGSVTLLLGADAAGNVISVDVKVSSGYPVLDRAASEYVKRHWTVPAGSAGRLFQTTITYRLQGG